MRPKAVRQFPEISKLIIIDVGSVLLGKQIGKDPMPPTLCQHDRAVHVLVQPLLEHTSGQVVACPCITSRIAAINAGPPIRAFLAALLNQAALKARVKGFFRMPQCSTQSYY